jgi:hypothetical protein
VVFTTLVLPGSAVAGCDGDEPSRTPRAAYECTDAGERDVHSLAAALDAPSETTRTFDLCRSRWHVAGVRIDPFLATATLGEAEASAGERFGCGAPVHPPNMLPGTAASLDCTIADVHVEVALLDEGDRISANIYPRR